jgi:hypothetical protein
MADGIGEERKSRNPGVAAGVSEVGLVVVTATS